MYVYVYVCVCVFVCTYVYIYIQIDTMLHTHIPVYMYMRIMCIYIYIYIYIYMYVCHTLMYIHTKYARQHLRIKLATVPWVKEVWEAVQPNCSKATRSNSTVRLPRVRSTQ